MAAKTKGTEKAKPAEEAKPKDKTKVYHIAKRASDGMWSIKFAGGEKVIKLFKTKEEAIAYGDAVAGNQGGIVLVHASKGAKAGKIQKQKTAGTKYVK